MYIGRYEHYAATRIFRETGLAISISLIPLISVLFNYSNLISLFLSLVIGVKVWYY